MKLRYRHLLLALVLVTLPLLFAGCLGGGSKPIIEDAFDGPGGDWGDDAQDGLSRGYGSGKYFFELTRPNWFAWTSSGRKLTDASVEVDAYLSSGPQDNHFGIICRLTDAGDFYYLAISSDGYYGIFRRVDGRELEPLNDAGAMEFSPEIRTGSEANRIEAVCEGEQLSLFANGKLLDTVTDATHSEGRIGFGAGSGLEGDVRIHFDDLAAYER